MSRWFAVVLALALGLTGCTAAAASGARAAGGAGLGDGGRLRVVTSFYPLQFVAERIGGGHADVSVLTRPGAEPHDLELTPKDVARMQDADLLVYLKGFQPAVDDAVPLASPRHALDVAPAARLSLTYTPLTQPGTTRQAEHADPHFWLDPQRLADVASVVEASMARVDPAHASTYAANLTRLRADLTTLDAELASGLAHCVNRELVTSHNAFGYFAQRYHLDQVGISGLSPEAEPEPRRLAQVAAFVRTHDVRTIYFETLLSPSIADTVAQETGARTRVLDPLEGLTQQSAGHDYLSVMRSDLAQLKEGQPCP